jgi:hypothetical protein
LLRNNNAVFDEEETVIILVINRAADIATRSGSREKDETGLPGPLAKLVPKLAAVRGISGKARMINPIAAFSSILFPAFLPIIREAMTWYAA